MKTQVSTERLMHLINLIERIERGEEQICKIQSDRKEIYLRARGGGFDVKAIQTIVKLRAMDQTDRDEQEALLGLYLSALGEDSTLGEDVA